MNSRQAKLGWGAVVVVAAAIGVWVSTGRAQPEKSLAPEQLLPADAVVYLGWDGDDAHRKEFEKTAAYKAIYETGLADVFKKLVHFAGEKISEQDRSAADIVKLVKQVYGKIANRGLSLAVSVQADAGPPMPYAVLVLHDAADLEPALSGLIEKAAGRRVEFKTEKFGRRSVTYANLPVRAPVDIQVGWWAEGKHLVIAGGADAIKATLSVAEGKTPNITTSRLWKKYNNAGAGFDPATIGWFDFGALRKQFGAMPIPNPGKVIRINDVLKAAGLNNLGAIVCRSGYKGEAVVSKTTVETDGKRSGLLALADQKPLSLSDLPPLPEGVRGFSACSVDWSKAYGTITKVIKDAAKLGPEDAAVQVEVFIDQIPAIVGVDVQKELFGSLGNVACAYSDDKQVLLGFGFAVALQVKNRRKLTEALDEILKRAQGNVPAKHFKVRRTKKHGAEIVTLEIAGGMFNPSWVVTDEWWCLGIYPQTAEAFVLRENGTLPTWKPSAELKAALKQVPARFTSIGVSDPRKTYQTLLGLVPIGYPLLQAGLRFFSERGGPEIKLPVSLADFPPAELVSRPLFPNVVVGTVDADGIHWTSRISMPSIPFLGGGSGTSVATTAVLIGLLLPAVQQAREAARRATSKNNLKQIGLAMHNYADTYRNFPPGTHPNEDLKPEQRLSWMASILPFIDQGPLHDRINFKKAWDDDANRRPLQARVEPYLNPQAIEEKSEYGHSHYIGIAGVGADAPLLPIGHKRAGAFGYNRKLRFRDVTDGLSNTICVAESGRKFGPWGAGGPSTIRGLTRKPYINGPDGIGGVFRGGANVLFLDGSVRFISENIEPKVMEGLSTISGGELIGDF